MLGREVLLRKSPRPKIAYSHSRDPPRDNTWPRPIPKERRTAVASGRDREVDVAVDVVKMEKRRKKRWRSRKDPRDRFRADSAGRYPHTPQHPQHSQVFSFIPLGYLVNSDNNVSLETSSVLRTGEERVQDISPCNNHMIVSR